MSEQQWAAFVDAFHTKHGRWPTASEVELGMGQRVTPIRVTAPLRVTAPTPAPESEQTDWQKLPFEKKGI